MSYVPNQDAKACKTCGLCGYTLRNCPQCIFCVFCKVPGHMVKDCDRVPPCGTCHLKGHPERLCPQRQFPAFVGAKRAGANQLSESRKRQNRDGNIDERHGRNIISVEAPRHDDERWLEIDPEIRSNLSLQPSFYFPNLRTLCKATIEDLMGGTLPGASLMSYREEVSKHGGVQRVAESLLKLIDSDIRGLEGQNITHASCFDAILSTGNLCNFWEAPVGYAGLAKDYRLKDWWRIYVGQCQNARRRIVSQHCQAVSKNSTKSLFYYLLWMGNGNRTASFFKLWSFPEDTLIDNWYQIRSNILEAVFCRAFRSHFGMLEPDGTLVGFGSNIMTPLIQGKTRLTEALRVKANIGPSQSPDPQIKHGAVFNPKQKGHNSQNGKTSHGKVLLFKCEFDAALQTTLEGNKDLYESVKRSLSPNPQIEPCPSNFVNNKVRYTGSLAASVGFVLDHFAIAEAEDFSSDPEGQKSPGQGDILPWPIQGCGFNLENVLCWAYNFERFSSITSDSFTKAALTPTSYTVHKEMHISLIANSALKIIYLCGPRAERAIKAAVKDLSQYTLEIRGHRYPFYLEGAASSKRIYIRCPPLPAEIWSLAVRESAIVSDAIRFGIHLLGIKEIRPYFVESSSVIGCILCYARKERLGGEPMKPDKLDDGIKLWLSRKGFQGEHDIQMIEALGGTLTRGLLMLLHALPRRPTNPESSASPESEKSSRVRRQRSHERVRCYEMFNKKRLEDMQLLVNDRIQSRQDNFVQRLSSLTPIPSDPGTNDSASLAAIEEFPQLYDQSEKIAKLQSQLALYQTGLTDQKAPEMHAYEDEARVDSLAALIDNARASRFLDPAVNTPLGIGTGSGRTPQRKGVVRQGQTTGKDLTGHGSRRWRGEAAVFREKEYRYTVPLGVSYRRTISLNCCPIQFPPGMDVGDGSVFVKIEICPPGQRHPEVYATSATDEDPASRLAFRVRYQDSAGLDRHFYAKDSNVTPVFRANTFVDILINDVPNETIAQTPRRWLYLKKGRSIGGLEKFEGGGYTSPNT